MVERIEPESCTCGQCGGVLHTIGEEISEKLDIKPVEFVVRQTAHAPAVPTQQPHR
ncbi:MAG: IS66 family transposase zinc-finger binding domain-containing protein [Xanthomonadales bacterium]|nr:IS66 family transposase zinc-finger binding domain-containing protein [Xanthomonadales bacterium]